MLRQNKHRGIPRLSRHAARLAALAVQSFVELPLVQTVDVGEFFQCLGRAGFFTQGGTGQPGGRTCDALPQALCLALLRRVPAYEVHCDQPLHAGVDTAQIPEDRRDSIWHLCSSRGGYGHTGMAFGMSGSVAGPTNPAAVRYRVARPKTASYRWKECQGS